MYGRVARTLLDMAEDDNGVKTHPPQGVAPGHGQGGGRLARNGQPGHEGPGRARCHRDPGKRFGDHQGTPAQRLKDTILCGAPSWVTIPP